MSKEGGKEKVKKAKSYLANLNLYSTMAHYVAKILKIRPNEIMDHWGVSELVVAFGYYANQQSEKTYQEIQEANKHSQKKIPQIDRYAVRFYTKQELEEESENVN